MSRETDPEILDMFIEHSDQILIVADVDYKIIKISHNWDRITGLNREKSIGSFFTDFVLDSDKNLFTESKQNGFEASIALMFGENILNFCCKVIKKKGYFQIILMNCQELVHLRNSEQKLLKVINSVYATIPFCMGIVKDRTILDVNKYMCDLLGYAKEELVNQNARILYPNDNEFNFVGNEKYKVMNKLGKAYVETKWITKNGKIIEIFLGSSYIDSSDKTAGAFFSATEKNKDIRYNVLQSSNNFAFEIFLESSNDGIIHHDSKNRILKWNKVSEQVFGIKSEDIVNKYIQDFSWEIYSKEGALLRIEEHPSIVSSSTSTEIDDVILKVISTDKKLSWIKVNSVPLKNSSNNVESIMIIFKDITAEYNLLEKIKDSEKLYRLVAEKTTDVIWLLGLDGKSIYVSPSVEKFTGYTQDEYLAQQITDRFVPEEKEKAIKLFRSGIELYLKHGELPKDFANKMRLQYLCKDGSIKWGELLVTPFFSDSGALTGIHGVTRDVTDEVKAAEELSKKNELFNSIYGHMPSGSGIYKVINDGQTAKDYIIVNYNKKSLEFTDKKLNEIIGKSLADIAPEVEDAGLIQLMQKVWRTGENAYTRLVINLSPDINRYFENYIFKIPSGEVVTIYNDITTSVLLEIELKNKTEKLNYALQASTEGVWEYDSANNYLNWDEGCFKMLGYAPDELAINTESWKDIIFENWEDIYKKARLQSDKSGKFSVEYRLKAKDGTLKWIQCKGIVIIANNHFRITGSHTDIEKQKKDEALLRESEHKYRSLFSNMTQAFALHKIITDDYGKPIDYVFTDFNDAFCNITGLCKDSIVGKRVKEILPQTEDYWIETYGNVAINNSNIIFEQYSSQFDKYFSVVAYCPEKNYFATIFTDITKSKHDEIKLKKLSLAVEQNPSSIVITDKNGNIEYVNQKFCEITGYSSEEAIGQNPRIIKSGFTPLETYQKLWDTLNLGEIWYGEIMNKRRNGEYYWESASISPVFNDSGEIINFLAIKEDITKNKQLAEQLEKHNLNYKKLLENLPNIVIIHIKGEIIFANNFALVEIGLSEEELIGRNILEYVHPDYKEIIIENLKLREAGHKLDNYEIKIIAQKKIRDVFMYIDDTDFQGEKATMVILIDITERKKFERELIESEEKFRVLSESTPFGIFMYRDNRWIYTNPAAEKITGFNSDELKEMIAWDIITDEFRDLVSFRANQRLKGKDVTSTYEIKINTKYNGEKWCLITAVVINYNDLPTGLVSVADITNIKTIETKLKISEEKFRNLAENTSDITWALDKDRIVTYISPADKKMRGFDNKDVIGKRLDDFLKNGLKNLTQTIRSTDESITDIIIPPGVYESELLCSDGSYIWTEGSVSHVFDENGVFIGYQGITRNISSRKLAEEALRKSDQLKTEFLNNISHEIRTPLNGILGFASLTAKGDVSDQLKEKYFEIMKQSSTRLIKTIDDYMDISLLLSKSMRYTKTSFDLISTYNKINSEFFSAFVKKRLEFSLLYPKNYKEYFVMSDEGLIEKILRQLLSNALKFTEVGAVSFGFEEYKNKIKLFVRDSGPGLSEESLNYATDFFYKTDFVNNKTNDGSGLGLSIVKGIVEIINGELCLENIPNAGLEASVILELFTNSVENQIVINSDKRVLSHGNVNILIAEDDDTNYLYLENMLRFHGFTNNQRAYNGMEALEVCNSSSPPDLIFMDIRMPVMDGIEATRKIKENHKDILIIATTAYAMKEEVEDIMKEDFDGYIAKPFTINQLLNCINNFFENKDTD